MSTENKVWLLICRYSLELKYVLAKEIHRLPKIIIIYMHAQKVYSRSFHEKLLSFKSPLILYCITLHIPYILLHIAWARIPNSTLLLLIFTLLFKSHNFTEYYQNCLVSAIVSSDHDQKNKTQKLSFCVNTNDYNAV